MGAERPSQGKQSYDAQAAHKIAMAEQAVEEAIWQKQLKQMPSKQRLAAIERVAAARNRDNLCCCT